MPVLLGKDKHIFPRFHPSAGCVLTITFPFPLCYAPVPALPVPFPSPPQLDPAWPHRMPRGHGLADKSQLWRRNGTSGVTGAPPYLSPTPLDSRVACCVPHPARALPSLSSPTLAPWTVARGGTVGHAAWLKKRFNKLLTDSDHR